MFSCPLKYKAGLHKLLIFIKREFESCYPSNNIDGVIFLAAVMQLFFSVQCVS